MVLNIDIDKTDNGFDIYLSDNNGGSGIEVSGETSHKVIENLMPYIHDYLYRLEYPEEFADYKETE